MFLIERFVKKESSGSSPSNEVQYYKIHFFRGGGGEELPRVNISLYKSKCYKEKKIEMYSEWFQFLFGYALLCYLENKYGNALIFKINLPI